ncbi:unnamed protein product [Caenorhabditis auriculariae]|uniref:SCP domain-containing protein n=1 Tax=Caenorhabditis auriculariae TaxID=2777116 RepID=A0A8S1GQW6_9PELO|nr:unnamed protein product [Caenorhabditis auriculariae]
MGKLVLLFICIMCFCLVDAGESTFRHYAVDDLLFVRRNAYSVPKKQTPEPTSDRVKRDADCPNGAPRDVVAIFTNSVAINMKWDCDLETKATQLVKLCTVDNTGAGKGSLKFSFELSAEGDAKSALVGQQKALQLAASNLNSKDQSGTKYQKIGCGFVSCQTRLDVLCLYS